MIPTRRSSLAPAAAVLAVLAVVGAGTARADDNALAEARAAFGEGETAYDEGENEVALERFRRAFALSPRAGIRFNIAVCLERLGRHREAVEEYRQAARSDELGEADVRRARELAEIARQRLGVLEVRGSPVGAAVLVDGARLCALPCRLELDPGSHELVALADDGQRSTPETVRITTGAVTNAELEATLPSRPPDRVLPRAQTTASTDVAPTRGPSALTWVGTALALGGTGLTIGLGLHALDIENRYREVPSASLRDEGLAFQVAANVSLGVAILGAVLIAVDLLFLAGR